MCGIFFSLSRHEYVAPNPRTEQLLQNRGPDSIGKHQTLIPTTLDGQQESSSQLHATFLSTVLSLRGTDMIEQPLKDAASGSALCWNGEAWSIEGHVVSISDNDSQIVFHLLLKHCRTTPAGDRNSSIARVVGLVSAIRGPFAFVFYDAENQHLYYGRDCLGRRSLLRKSTSNHDLILSSVRDNTTGDSWAEVEADGLYVFDLKNASSQSPFEVVHIPHRRRDENRSNTLSFDLPFPAMNKASPIGAPHPNAQDVHKLRATLLKSLGLRIQHVRESFKPPVTSQHDARIAILFSGGLDCTVLARMSHDLLPLMESIDLLNVAFENPRIHSRLESNASPYELCPDRITGRASYSELVRACPGRCWRFVEIDIPYGETIAHRAKVMTLMHPHNTEMDLSIACALYFASRGVGLVRNEADSPTPYSTPAHVLLSGLGADELFGGYQRHAVAFSRRGYPGLIEELELDFNRLGKRNLGRDDRVISDSGKEVRFPYLDEGLIAFALDLPVYAKCDFANHQLDDSDDPARLLEPGKRVLRLLAWDLGMKGVAAEKKRAIQFGARTAKMETGKTKGTQALS